MAKKYEFHDKWEINTPLNRAWEIISDPAGWQTWWPGLSSAVITSHDPAINGSTVQLKWRSKSGYYLCHAVTITSILPSKIINFTSHGDLKGYGSWKFQGSNGNTQMLIDWYVEPTKKWMISLDLLLHHLFIKNHNTLMKQGEAGLNKYALRGHNT
jgi:hypothetical protein